MTVAASNRGAGLRQLSTPLFLQTSTDQIIEQFYVPALQAASHYDRGVGYFTSGWIRMVSQGLSKFADSGGRARFIVSPHMSQADWDAIRAGTEARRDAAIRSVLDSEIRVLAAAESNEDVACLGMMVADGILDFKLALPHDELGGDFHDKFGIFTDEFGNSIGFHGSQNDSAHAFANFEAISLFYSWLGGTDSQRIVAHSERFERLWRGEMPHVRILALPEAVKEGLKALGKHRSRADDRTKAETDNRWRHQDEACAAFMSAGAGILEMATGTGKTRTAIRILCDLHAQGLIRSAVITMSGTDLLDQWYGELASLESFVVHRSYGGHHEALAFLNNPQGAILLASRQALGASLSRLPPSIAKNALLVCDEVHGIGSPSLLTELAGKLMAFRYRLGLSATPEREYDGEGSAFIDSEIGPVIFRFGLEEAIRRGILCEFDYVELNYEFSDDDKLAVRRAIASYHAKVRAGQDPGIETMYRDIAQVAKTSQSKLPHYIEFIGNRADTLQRAIIFVDNVAYGLNVQDIILPVAPRYHTYYAEDDRMNLIRFAKGGLDTLITCHRISEGIDIQSVNSVVLFSSARARLETVQRLGRCLRKDPKNPEKRPTVIDFIRCDDIKHEPSSKPTTDQIRRDWLRGLASIRVTI